MTAHFETAPRQRNFQRPTAVDIRGIIQRAVNMYGRLQPLDVPFVQSVAVVLVRFRKKEIPLRVESIDFQFTVLMAVSVGIEEDFEIIVMEDNLIAFGDRGPHMRLLQFGADIEIDVVAKHFHMCTQIGSRLLGSFDIDEIVAPCRGGPCFVVEPAVDNDGRSRRYRDRKTIVRLG